MPHASWGEPGLSRTVKVPVPGGGIQLNVHPELEVIFTELVERLDAARQRAGKPRLTSAGGYHKRYISGTTRWSNHSWGLAGDFNPAANPYSTTFRTDFPVEETRATCRDLGIRWGGDYAGKKDPMHFEFMGSRDDARALTTRLLTPTAPPTEDDDMTEDDRKIRNQQHDQLLGHLAADRVTALNTEKKVGEMAASLKAIEGYLDRLAARGL